MRAKVAKCGAHRTGAAQGLVGKERWTLFQELWEVAGGLSTRGRQDLASF